MCLHFQYAATHSTVQSSGRQHVSAYYKPSSGLLFLRNIQKKLVTAVKKRGLFIYREPRKNISKNY
jgi:hypothetical protein